MKAWDQLVIMCKETRASFRELSAEIKDDHKTFALRFNEWFLSMMVALKGVMPMSMWPSRVMRDPFRQMTTKWNTGQCTRDVQLAQAGKLIDTWTTTLTKLAAVPADQHAWAPVVNVYRVVRAVWMTLSDPARV
jgi:hypothetical protein